MTASRPPKPWYRPRNVILALLVLTVAWLGMETYRALTAAPGRSVDYVAQLNELVASHQVAGASNGWADWEVALKTLSDQMDLARQQYGDSPPSNYPFAWPVDFQSITDPALPEDIRRQTLELMEAVKAAGLHDQLARAAANDSAYRVFPPTDRLIEILLPELGHFRHLARYQAGRMRLAAAASDWDDFAMAFDQAMRSGHVLSQQGVLIDHLVGYAIHSLALNELNAALEQYDPPAETLERLAASVDRSPPGPIELALRAEHILTLDTIQWTHTDNGRGNGRLILSEANMAASLGSGTSSASLPAAKIFNVLSILLPSKKQTTRKADEFFKLAIEWASMTTDERKRSDFKPSQWADDLPYGYVLLKIMIPALEKSITAHDRIATEYTQARLTLAIKRFHADRGDYPATLDELVPTFLAEVPRDPTTGSPFVYQRSPADKPSIAPYSLVPSATEPPPPAETAEPDAARD